MIAHFYTLINAIYLQKSHVFFGFICLSLLFSVDASSDLNTSGLSFVSNSFLKHTKVQSGFALQLRDDFYSNFKSQSYLPHRNTVSVDSDVSRFLHLNIRHTCRRVCATALSMNISEKNENDEDETTLGNLLRNPQSNQMDRLNYFPSASSKPIDENPNENTVGNSNREFSGNDSTDGDRESFRRVFERLSNVQGKTTGNDYDTAVRKNPEFTELSGDKKQHLTGNTLSNTDYLDPRKRRSQRKTIESSTRQEISRDDKQSQTSSYPSQVPLAQNVPNANDDGSLTNLAGHDTFYRSPWSLPDDDDNLDSDNVDNDLFGNELSFNDNNEDDFVGIMKDFRAIERWKEREQRLYKAPDVQRKTNKLFSDENEGIEKANENEDEDEVDDEELPFSAEQTNKLETRGVEVQGNLVDTQDNKYRRKKKKKSYWNASKTKDKSNVESEKIVSPWVGRDLKSNSSPTDDFGTRKSKETISNSSNNNSQNVQPTKERLLTRQPRPRKDKPKSNRKMIRRGMEMLVAGQPINADPPHRCIDLLYRGNNKDWAQVITLSTKDFGPLLHTASSSKVSPLSRALYCENFLAASLKWKICPKDLRAIVSNSNVQSPKGYKELVRNMDSFKDTKANDNNSSEKGTLKNPKNVRNFDQQRGDDNKLDDEDDFTNENENLLNEDDPALMHRRYLLSSNRGFGRLVKKYTKKKSSSNCDIGLVANNLGLDLTGGELKFTLSIDVHILKQHDDGASKALSRILSKGISDAISEKSLVFDARITDLKLTSNFGKTYVSVQFSLHSNMNLKVSFMKKLVQDVNHSLSRAVDSGGMALSIANAAEMDKTLSRRIKEEIIADLLHDFDDEEVEEYYEVDSDNAEKPFSDYCEPFFDPDVEKTGPFGGPNAAKYSVDDLFLGGGNGGVFADYSEKSIDSAPFKGQVGLRMVDAAVERAKARHPRVIAIGDVHGCIDELQSLLRLCDYSPGDLIVFLGDLVSKGPDSLSVVQMAREIGAIGVRGNHDFEVVRWHQAIMAGAEQPIIGSEHFHIASALSNADLKWMYSLPWFISSKELGALFVHAGFVSGIKLAKQNPRLMMNMRSILPDGTVTSKFFKNWPWARLWDGPQTVLFGHDADRGLQQYEHGLGLDTGCVYGGQLTACILPEKRLVSVSAKREYYQFRRKHY